MAKNPIIGLLGGGKETSDLMSRCMTIRENDC